jgi:hypothetical protein
MRVSKNQLEPFRHFHRRAALSGSTIGVAHAQTGADSPAPSPPRRQHQRSS